ncbi:Ni/Fe-hydrogenase, b-type cytochrome subunit [Novosphingobium sp. CF614]|uniref:cytochrome b/b6 domain-containing protein n=1 Tax=Novosphingobium sp. CF614 TaxID=1884364 RepID=UPI0008E92F14|nr:cytochrome b/b6 domain-containing protein [Novosphingobium sp. CF614]SFF90894.1 Ni/Fe-hydrogenase, b-type cytochrome subunit [Novosphingobium sp. CF614]
MSESVVAGTFPRGGELLKRHRLSTRIWHWVNAVTLFVMLLSGLMIFNAHPRLYWGEYGANPDTPWLKIGSARTGPGESGYLQLGGARIETTGVLGIWTDQDGNLQRRAFPYWATIPSRYSLAGARIWHLAFAWVLALGLLFYLLWSLVTRHLQRDIHITRAEWRPTHIWHDIKEHARLRFPTGAAALKYNVLQKIAYAGVLFVLLPLMILTGLAMSPGTDAWLPAASELFGGRQSARSVHFICAFLLVLFFLVHIAMVVLAGPFNEVRSMITGRYRLPPERSAPKETGQ